MLGRISPRLPCRGCAVTVLCPCCAGGCARAGALTVAVLWLCCGCAVPVCCGLCAVFSPEYATDTRKSVLVYIPDYFDFVRLRNHFRTQQLSFGQICEYTTPSNVSRYS